MSSYEVPEPIQSSPFEPPSRHRHIVEGEAPVLRPGRRPPVYYYRDPKARDAQGQAAGGTPIELELVNRVREKVDDWRGRATPA